LVAQADARRAAGRPPVAGGGAGPAGAATLTQGSGRPAAGYVSGRDGAAARSGAGCYSWVPGSGGCRTGWELRVAQTAPFRASGGGSRSRPGRRVASLGSRGSALRRHRVAGDRRMNEPPTA
jgi:hypothetical protein